MGMCRGILGGECFVPYCGEWLWSRLGADDCAAVYLCLRSAGSFSFWLDDVDIRFATGKSPRREVKLP